MALAEFVERLWTIKGDASFAAVAKRAGISHVTLWRIMKGQRRPSARVLMALITAFPELGTVLLSSGIPDEDSTHA
ncbi:MAG: helix-turn-helix transcriptional regulator [Anaerolineae bacterium]|mgnify:CR=1 FL=1|jgi:transcriptional regulator with XRE-family HTH domain|nr:helix-turn-helix transcriptional regulator [Anaerolineae bacterium]